MIRHYNQVQMIHAVVSVIGGILCSSLAYWFFRFAAFYGAELFNARLQAQTLDWIGAGALLIVFISGYRTWQKGGGLLGYHESALYHDLGTDTAGAMVVDFYAHRITAPAHVLSQLFLAGPLLLLRVGTLIKSRIPEEHGLEQELDAILEVLKKANKWQPLTDYPSLTREILFLAQMKLIDFSSHTQIPRIKTLD